jgi:hypothetical protein
MQHYCGEKPQLRENDPLGQQGLPAYENKLRVDARGQRTISICWIKSITYQSGHKNP